MTSRRTLLQALGAAAVVPASAGTDPASHADDCLVCRIVAGIASLCTRIDIVFARKYACETYK